MYSGIEEGLTPSKTKCGLRMTTCKKLQEIQSSTRMTDGQARLFVQHSSSTTEKPLAAEPPAFELRLDTVIPLVLVFVSCVFNV
jgi:hypothetical protein